MAAVEKGYLEINEPQWLLPILSPGDEVIDVGANHGDWTIPLASVVGPEGRVIAFEPASETAGSLRKRIEEAKLSNVIVIETALGAVPGQRRLYHHSTSDQRHSLADTGTGSDFELVEQETLDGLADQLSVERLRLIKVDTEGADELVLEGGRQTIQKHRPMIIFEVNPERTESMGLRHDGAWVLLTELGYAFYALNRHRRLLPIQHIEDAQTHPIYWNVVAIYSSSLSSELDTL